MSRSKSSSESPLGIEFWCSELSIPNEDQRFCILACSGCHKLFPRHFSLRVFYCTTCHQSTHLTPRCRFEVTIIDNTGFASTTISDKIGEELLSLTSEEIYGIRCHKKQLLPLANVQNKLMGKTFNIQMKMSFTKSQDTLPGKLFILSLKEKERVNNLLLPTTVMDFAENNKKTQHGTENFFPKERLKGT
ncbi:hypothetical protein K7X08_005051 [Anisodus acutangulus]|uniref:Replication factor A C-terminal domain-containing protein n=1 Tax=Anisodus acutangulus TaxID=402998 RepID=A0A9Q1RJ29_9SOLA|nr:hypothetical protein K7X08_005051 [Anisodus acutangulus]